MADTTSRRAFLQTAALAAAATGFGLTAQRAQAQSRRNIVFILIDDMRFDAMGWMKHPFLETPHLDALAANGAIFENAFVTTSLCSPSRASILTGQYAHTHGVADNATAFPTGAWTFPQALQQAGYRTGFVGKWHMGGSGDEPQPGFDHWVSFKGQGVYVNPEFNINGERKAMEGYVTDLITDEAANVIRTRGDKPFFLYVSHKAVHAEFKPAPRHADSYKDKTYPHPASMADTEENYRGKPEWVRKQRNSWHGVDGMYDRKVVFDDFTRAYAETMRAVDDSVGRIVETLRSEGLLESTLLVFTSDNGFLFGEHGLIDKRCMYEPSIRVPLIVHCPEMITPGTRRAELALNLDFAPTFLDAVGAPLPASLQGRSILDLWKDGAPAWRDAFLYEYFWEQPFVTTPTMFGVRTARHKLIKPYGVADGYELYDLQTDPDEMNNLIAGYQPGSAALTMDGAIRRRAPEELKALYIQLSDRLAELMNETDASARAKWTKAP